MDREQFRLILLLIGAALIAGVYLWDRMRGGDGARFGRLTAWLGTFRQRAEPKRRAPASRDEPHIGEAGLDDLEAPFDDDVILGPVRRVARGSRRRTPVEPPNEMTDKRVAVEPGAEAPPAEPEPEPEVIVMMLTARAGRIGGIRLSRAMEASGLHLGEMSIFHHVAALDDGEETLYSVANLVEPGTFDTETMATFSTPGIALFMTLPGPSVPLVAFDAMLATAYSLAESLDGVLVDARRKPLDEAAIAALRDRAEAASTW